MNSESVLTYQNKMTQYNTLNVKLANSIFNKSKPGIKNGTKVTLKLPSNAVGGYNDGTNFPQELLLTNTKVSRLRKAFMSNASAKNYQKPNNMK